VVPVALLGLLVGAWWVARAIDHLIGSRHFVAPAIGWTVAFPFLAIGVALMIWSVSRFFLARGTPVPFNPPPVLVTTGPYRYTRHPMVTGFILMILGLGLGSQSLAVIFIMLPLSMALFAWEIRVFEEPQLCRRFGDAYIEYRRQVPMFLPRLKSRKSGQILP
jgi:protein-S-isoprenylcysteine O-methyltransferase Ste14